MIHTVKGFGIVTGKGQARGRLASHLGTSKKKKRKPVAPLWVRPWG